MTTLLQRCQAVSIKVEQLTLAQRHANQQRQVQERTREWTSRRDKMKDMNARATCLTLDAEALARVTERRAHLRHNAAQVLERLRAHDDIGQLTGDDSWMRLLASVEGLTEELVASGKLAWKSHIEEQGGLEDPSWLRDRAPSTPTNAAAIAAYQTHYGVYAGLVRLTMPRNSGDLVQLSQIVATSRAELAKIQFDVPPEVQLFFQAIQLGNATLAVLTSGVLEWLTENGQLDRYRIRSTGQ